LTSPSLGAITQHIRSIQTTVARFASNNAVEIALLSYFILLLFFVLRKPILTSQEFLTSCFLLALPFALWRVCLIGGFPKWATGGIGLTGGYVPEPRAELISVSQIVDAIPPEWHADLRRDAPFVFKVESIPLFIETVLKRHFESDRDTAFHGILVDFADENVMRLTISSNERWSRLLGGPFYQHTA
jgi:hypothetical protein